MSAKETKEIIEKVLDKVYPDADDQLVWFENLHWRYSITIETPNKKSIIMEEDNIESLIFSHKFAKAFWGEEVITLNRIKKAMKLFDEDDMDEDEEKAVQDYYCNQYFTCNPIQQIIYMWQYHLQQMVLEENPLKYLEKFL